MINTILSFLFLEAIDAICKHSVDELSILKRKIITKEILFEYLHENSISISLPATKNALVEKICSYWNVHNCGEQLVKHNNLLETSIPLDNDTIGLFTVNFGQWFYSLLNSDSGVEAQHFWPDAKFKLNMISLRSPIAQYIENTPHKIAELLFRVKTEHNLHFNPNLAADSVKYQTDPHGLVIILLCGTLHKNNVLVGIFEQTFALARDPFSENNWKIKNSELNLKDTSAVVTSQEPIEMDEQLYLTN